MKIIQFGLHYSPNVGDGIIAECLVHGLTALRPGTEVVTVDLSGRTGFDHAVVRNRELALKLLSLMPKPLRGRAVETRLKPILDRAEPAWRAALDGADLALIGGGQILSDADLNFPVKIARAARLLRATGTPTAIFAAGVARNWSARGTRLFRDVLETDLRQVGLRDGPSVEAWRDQIGGAGPAPVLTRDPGLLAAACYGRAGAEAGRPIGLCVMDMGTAAYHAEGAVAGGPALFADVARELARRGHSVTLFCNGAAEDRAALAAVAERVRGTGIAAAPAPATPADLAAIVRGCGAVIAHRLHACIVAYSYGLPIVGLGWDRKLESFFASVGAESGFVGAAGATPDQIADLTEAALDRGIDPVRHARVLDEARTAVAAVFDLVSALPRPATGAAAGR